MNGRTLLASEVESETQEETQGHIKGEIWDRILPEIKKEWEFKEVRKFDGFGKRQFQALDKIAEELKENGWHCRIERKDDMKTGNANYCLLISKWPIGGSCMEWLTKRVDAPRLAAGIVVVIFCASIVSIVVWLLLKTYS